MSAERPLKTGKKGLELIKSFEGFSSKAYICPAGKPTIGWGHWIKSGELFSEITEEQAEILLMQDLSEAERTIINFVKKNINQDQFDSLASFIFNLGSDNFKKSTLLRRINEGDFHSAALQFSKWILSNGAPLKGLAKRRFAEAELFCPEMKDELKENANRIINSLGGDFIV